MLRARQKNDRKLPELVRPSKSKNSCKRVSDKASVCVPSSLHLLPCLAAASIRLSLERYPPVRGRFPICFPTRFAKHELLLVVFGTCHE